VEGGLVLVLSLLLLAVLRTDAAKHSWSYNAQGDDGPDHWGMECGTGTRQSPINLPREGLERVTLAPLKLENYELAPESMQLINNGHTAKISFKLFNETKAPRVSGGGLAHKYRLAQIHFHWGKINYRGSEHTKSNATFPMEMHLVHFKDEYPTLMDALAEPTDDTLAVIGIFFKLQLKKNVYLTDILDKLKDVREADTSTQIKPFTLENLLPTKLDKFYRYSGSLTTPGCNEIVTWTVLHEPVHISLEQLDKFRYLEQKDGTPLVDNFRPVQPVGSRKVLDVMTLSDVETSGSRAAFLSATVFGTSFIVKSLLHL